MTDKRAMRLMATQQGRAGKKSKSKKVYAVAGKYVSNGQVIAYGIIDANGHETKADPSYLHSLQAANSLITVQHMSTTIS